MQVNTLDTTGKLAGKTTLSDEIFSQKPNDLLLAQAVKVYLSNQRTASARVKTRGQVRGSRRKIWRQKGTGRARHGDRYAPIFVGGGVAHGPSSSRHYKLKLPKKMRRKALFVALSEKLREKEIVIVEGLDKLEPKTKTLISSLEKIIKKPWGKITIIIPEEAKTVVRATRNIENVNLKSAKRLNAYQVLNAGQILIMKNATDTINETYLKKSKKLTKQDKAIQSKPKKPKAKTVKSTAKKTKKDKD